MGLPRAVALGGRDGEVGAEGPSTRSGRQPSGPCIGRAPRAARQGLRSPGSELEAGTLPGWRDWVETSEKKRKMFQRLRKVLEGAASLYREVEIYSWVFIITNPDFI